MRIIFYCKNGKIYLLYIENLEERGEFMKFRHLLKRLFIIVFLFNNIHFNSSANTLFKDTRYELFEGDSIRISDIIEPNMVDVNIEGNTLANLIDTSNLPIEVTNFTSVEDKYAFLKEVKSKTCLKAGRVYTLFLEYNITSYAALDSSGDNRVKMLPKLTYIDDTVSYLTIEIIQSEGSYSNVVKIIPNKDVTKFEIGLAAKNVTVSGNIDYFDGIKSVGELENNDFELVYQNKNLWDGTYEEGSIYTGTNNVKPGEDSDSGINRKRSYYIPVKPNTTYVISQKDYLNESHSTIFLHQYDKNKKNLFWSNGLSYMTIGQKVIFRTGKNTFYLRFRTQDNRNLDLDSVMIEEGENATNIIRQVAYKKI